MKFSCSLKLNHIFSRLYKSNPQANAYLVLYCRPNHTGKNRVGITVSKKLGKAVIRNRVRRRLREVYRLNEGLFTPGYDIVIVARSKTKYIKSTRLAEIMRRIFAEKGMLKSESEIL